ncbi:DUF4366 domain-containing protein, partial [Dysosmobacter welbionis]
GLGRFRFAGVGLGGEGGHGVRRILLGRHTGGEIPHRFLQIIVLNLDGIVADDAALFPHKAGEGDMLLAEDIDDVADLVLDLIDLAPQVRIVPTQTCGRQHQDRADCRAREELPPPAPPGAPDRLQIFLYDGLHRRQLPVGQLPRRGGALHAFTGGFRGIFFGTVLRRFRLYSQQGADGDAKDPAHGDQVLQFRHGGVRLPLAHRLAADAQPLPQGFLREAGGLSGLLDAAAQGLLLPHGINSFAPTIPES